MIRIPKLTARQVLIVLHDLLATMAAIVVTFLMRFEGAALTERLRGLERFLPFFLLYAAVVYFIFGLHRNKWRFTSIPDLYNLFRASTVLAISLLALDYVLVAPNIYGTFFFGKVTILLYWFLQMFFLGGLRVVYRYFHYARTLQRVKVADATPTLILGRAADAEVLLRGIESGAVKKIWPVGVLSPSAADRGQSIRGIPVLGDIDDLEGVVADLESRGDRVRRLVLAPSALALEARPEAILMRARRLGLNMSQMPSLETGGSAVQLSPVAVEDLLLRPSVKIDYRRLEDFISGKAVVVTGGGGSIGSEICDRVVIFGAARLLVIETFGTGAACRHGSAQGQAKRRRKSWAVSPIFATVQRIMSLDRPVQAATLCFTPLRSSTFRCSNKIGTKASRPMCSDRSMSPMPLSAAGATAMVMISTDKAIEPVSVLGATKRLAEMYCQALDDEFSRRATPGHQPMRLISVRFGNVLASNGSVVPKFKAQIEAGGPVTVTHPDMVRYFMTIREACDLVVTAATHALGNHADDVSVYVLNMGQPVKIVDLAERIIRLSGLEPGRDIQISYTGVRPGERLNEILFARGEETSEIGIPGIVAAKPVRPPLDAIRAWVATLEQGVARGERAAIYNVLRDAVPEFRGEAA